MPKWAGAVAAVAAAFATFPPSAALGDASDVSAPVISRQVSGTAGNSGWFRGPVNVRWTVVDRESPWTTSGCDARTIGAETRGMRVECRASSSGGTSSDSMLVKIDSTAPSVTGSAPDRAPDQEGWYNHPVAFTFTGADALSGIAGCGLVPYAGPDSPAASVTGGCKDVAGNEGLAPTAPFAYDATGPEILRAFPARRPDHRRWFRRPVRFAFRARDALSGRARCAKATYKGPDGVSAVSAVCTDRGGNVSTRSFPVRFDATPPDVAMRLRAGSRMAVVKWRTAPDARFFVLSRWLSGAPWTRRVVYRGVRHRYVDKGVVDRRRYRYALVAFDRAGHRAVDRGAVTPHRALLAPATGVKLTAPPLLRWTPVLRARYYNVQLVRNGRRTILSEWPARPRFRVPAAWSHKGRAHTLAPGTYTWYVWAALGRNRNREYGVPIGHRHFEVVPAGG